MTFKIYHFLGFLFSCLKFRDSIFHVKCIFDDKYFMEFLIIKVER